MQRLLLLIAPATLPFAAAAQDTAPASTASPTASPTAPASAADPARESRNAHFQTTCIPQVQPSFRSPYAGVHGLRGAAGASYSLTGTASFGLRLGESTELDADPEVAQGGDASTVDRDADQLRSVYDAHRAVITAGNLSVLDVFDNDACAHDPRTQFMNWALTTCAACDYPADARAAAPAGPAPDLAPVRGARSSRANDVVGLAVAADAIGGAHRASLERGGTTTFLGDGRDRGPVSFFALRLHGEV